MFVRVIDAAVVSKALLRNAWDHLHDELARTDVWSASVGGVGSNGRFLATMCFTSPSGTDVLESDPLVARWWADLHLHLEEPTVQDSTSADILIPGGSEAATFVQFIRGRSSDPERMSAINKAMQAEVQMHRPEILGSSIAWHAGGVFTETVYFTSEQEARLGESREFPGGIKGLFEELMQLVQEIAYIDVRSPWMTAHP